MEEIKYSILIPAYNVEKYIERALNSVFNQTYRGNIEIIVCNDGSTDATLNILMGYSNRIKILVNQTNSRGVITRNKLIRESKGKYIVWLDADDTLDKNFLLKIDEILKKDDYDIVQVSTRVINLQEKNSYINDLGNKKICNKHCLDVFFNHHLKFMMWGKAIKRNIMNKQMPPDKIYEFDDVFYAIPMFYYCKKYVSTSDVLYNYYLNSGYWSKTLDDNYNMTEEQYNKILMCRVEEWNYNAEFLLKNELFEKYKSKLLWCCDLNRLFLDLVKIEDKSKRLKALSELNQQINIMIWIKNGIQPF